MCISSTDICITAGMACGEGAGMCNANGTCGMGADVCGGVPGRCCGVGIGPAGAFCSQSGTTCVGNGANRRCVACGGANQPPC